MYYDPIPHIGYRQHGRNVVGTNTGLGARLSRLGMLLGGRFAEWSGRNLAGLAACGEMLQPAALATIAAFDDVRRRRGFSALTALRVAGLYRQTPVGNLALQIAAFVGKI